MNQSNISIEAKRILLLLLGLCIAHLGVALFLLADLGSDPFNVFVQGLLTTLNRFVPLPLTHGRVHIMVSLCIIAILFMVDRSYVRIGTVLCMALGGLIIDAYMLVGSRFYDPSASLTIRVVMQVIGCVVLAFGMTIVISSEAGTGPNDLVAVVISDKLHKPFAPVRILVDGVFAGLGFAQGGTVGLGTLICVFLVGPVAQIFFPFSRKLCGRLVPRIHSSDESK